jgi:peptide/nickel transport system substrate-binding protein
MSGKRLHLTTLALVMILSACTQQPQSPSAPSAGGGSQPSQPQARAPKVLTVAAAREPTTFEGYTEQGIQGGAGIAMDIAHNLLVVRNDKNVYVPQLAVEQLSVEKGTWRLNPDGSMDTTWKIHPNVKWHDGTPFTSADLLFTFQIAKDPDLPVPNAASLRQMESATAPDAQTLIIHWPRTYVRADEALGLIPRPKHLLEDLYRNDRNAFVNSPYFSTEFLGLGPYRLTKWEPGSHLEFTAFNDYFRGRPPLDTVVVRYIADPNTMVANILSGTVDVIVPPSTDVEGAAEVQRRWQGTPNKVHFNVTGDIRRMQLQVQPEFAQPRGVMTNRAFRQGLMHAIDRQAIAEAMTQGRSPIADSWMPPNEGLRPHVENAIPQYPYDPTRALARLEEAGWVRGSDGVLANRQTGERFSAELWTSPGTGVEKESYIIADGVKVVGMQLGVYVIPPARAQDRELQAKVPFAILSDPRWELLWEELLHSSGIPTEANRWSGRNRGGYNNPAYDAIVDRLKVTIEPSQRIELHRQLLQEGMGDVATIPLYWVVDPVFIREGVNGILEGSRGAWNFFEWNKS